MANDIMLGSDNDLIFRAGDLVIGESFEQEVKILIALSKGDLKSDPVLGCDIIRLMNSGTSNLGIIQKIKLNLERDNKQVGNITINNGIINISPND